MNGISVNQNETNVEEITVNSFTHFIEIIEKNDFTRTIYRGEPANDTPLIPKLGRVTTEKRKVIRELEKKLYGGFVARAHAYLDFEPKSKCEWLAVAQHYGLPTRLLDWTESPLVAAFFATRRDVEGVVYSTQAVQHVDPSSVDPFNIKQPGLMRLPSRFDRMKHQSGLFSISLDPTTPFQLGNMRKMRIAREIRLAFVDFLLKCGVTDEALFPGLEGLSRYISLSRGYDD